MFERFTDRARRVAILSQEEARLLNHHQIGTEHHLLGLIHEGEGIAALALAEHGITLEAARTEVEKLSAPMTEPFNGHMPYTPRSKKILELSLREALQLGHNYIGTEHILLGLIREGQGKGCQVIVTMGVQLHELRETIIRILSGYAGKESRQRLSGPSSRRGTARAEDADWNAALVIADALKQETQRDALRVVAAMRRLGWTPPA